MYSPAQSDIDRSRAPEESQRAHDELEMNAAPVAATKIVYVAMGIVFFLLFVVIMAIHAPSGG
ncbi:MAG TPA: hypothetical protein VGM39_17380 [Kofleriaceae bacterium]|jgi:hypothetical protein